MMTRAVVSKVLLALVSSLALVPGLYAQAKPEKDTGLYRIEGTVIAMNKDKSTFTVRQRNRANVVMTIAYTADTKFSYLNKPATLDDVKDSRQVICLGKLNEKESTQMTASVIDVRTPKKY